MGHSRGHGGDEGETGSLQLAGPSGTISIGYTYDMTYSIEGIFVLASSGNPTKKGVLKQPPLVLRTPTLPTFQEPEK
jgi:hypothetical protein